MSDAEIIKNLEKQRDNLTKHNTMLIEELDGAEHTAEYWAEAGKVAQAEDSSLRDVIALKDSVIEELKKCIRESSDQLSEFERDAMIADAAVRIVTGKGGDSCGCNAVLTNYFDKYGTLNGKGNDDNL